ncbi:MAG: DNA-protecting protein DprA [Cytophagales bacterium]|nr:DNA-protecting protein DprA [Armatimonadota bacterium]
MPGEPTRFLAADAPDGFIACQRLADALLPPPRLRALLDAVGGDPLAVFRLSLTALAAPPILLTEKQATRLKAAASAPLPPRLLEQAKALDATILTFRDRDYPANLLPLSDAPPLLFVRGALRPDDRFSVAIVGSRRATIYGREQSNRFAQGLAERGLCIVSGGALGIDTSAHQGALAAGGRTIAVLGCGIDVGYPAENRALFATVVERGGAVISEFPMGTKPEPWRFPTRNRIIAGIARATLVVETPEASGALITARNAAEYGRDVWVVPGAVDTGRSRGGHKLVQDGASLADAPGDILEALGIAPEEDVAPRHTPHPKADTPPEGFALVHDASPGTPERSSSPLPPPPLPANLSGDEAALLPHFDLSPRHLDEASAAAGLSASQATVAATLLEMKALIRRQPGSLFVRVL